MGSITSIMFSLSITSSTKVKTFDRFHFTHVLGAIGVVKLLVSVNGMFVRFTNLEHGFP